MRFDHKHMLGDHVFLEGDDKGWYVTGIMAKVGYDVFLWNYQLTRAIYGDYHPNHFGGRCDVECKLIGEDKILSLKQAVELRRVKVESRVESMKTELEKLEKELASLSPENQPGETDVPFTDGTQQSDFVDRPYDH